MRSLSSKRAPDQFHVFDPSSSSSSPAYFEYPILQVKIQPTPATTFAADVTHFPQVQPSHKPNVDKIFLRQLTAILRIAFPSLTSKETLIVVLHSLFLVLRTVLSVGVAKLDGRIVRDLVSNPLQSLCSSVEHRSSGEWQWTGIFTRSGMVVRVRDSQHIYKLNGSNFLLFFVPRAHK